MKKLTRTKKSERSLVANAERDCRVDQAQMDSGSLLRGNPQQPRPLRAAVAASAAGWMLVVLALFAVGRGMSMGCTDPCAAGIEYQGCLSWTPTLGAAAMLLLLPLSAMATGNLTVELGREGSQNGLAAVAVAGVIGAALCLIFLMKPWSAFDYMDELDVNKQKMLANDVLQVLLGGAIFLTCLVLSATAVLAIRRGRAQGGSFEKQAAGLPDSRLSIQGSGPAAAARATESTAPALDSTRMTLAILGLCLLMVVLCSFFSPVWNYSFRSYAHGKSPYSLLQGEFWEKGFFNLCGHNDPGSCDNHYVLKLFPDTVMFYAWLGALALVGGALVRHKDTGALLHKRLRVGPASSYNPYAHGASVGELSMVVCVLGLYGWWLYYWRWGYDRIEKESSTVHNLDKQAVCCTELKLPIPTDKPAGTKWGAWNDTWSAYGAGPCFAPPDEHPSLQTWARVMGHLTTLSCSLLLLPVTKNSAWFHVLGVPFERALKYHRGLGYLVYMFVTVHMVLWWIKWSKEGILWNNLTRPDNTLITKYWPHPDNFTIVVAQLAWLALTGMIGLAVFARRAAYELFYYIHVPVGISFLAAAVMHAWSFWYYGAIGLFLWSIDAALRTVRSSSAGSGRPTRATFDPVTCVTKLSFPLGAFQHDAPAQYLFLTVPAIAVLERHPFTISSAPNPPQVIYKPQYVSFSASFSATSVCVSLLAHHVHGRGASVRCTSRLSVAIRLSSQISLPNLCRAVALRLSAMCVLTALMDLPVTSRSTKS